jgi:hypothetical protein
VSHTLLSPRTKELLTPETNRDLNNTTEREETALPPKMPPRGLNPPMPPELDPAKPYTTIEEPKKGQGGEVEKLCDWNRALSGTTEAITSSRGVGGRWPVAMKRGGRRAKRRGAAIGFGRGVGRAGDGYSSRSSWRSGLV